MQGKTRKERKEMDSKIEEAEYVLYARVDVYADLGTGEGHNVGEGVTGLHPHEGEPVDAFMIEYRYRFPEGRSPEYGPWDALAGCGRITPEDGDVEGWEQVYDLLDDLHVETSWEEGPVWGALSDPEAIADRIRAGLMQGRE